MKNSKPEIKNYNLDPQLYYIHKKGMEQSDFGLDNSTNLIDDGFGLYSNVDMKNRIGPAKTQYYRIALYRSGSASIDLGIESYRPERNCMVFGFPGQVFSIYDMSDDLLVYYMLFKETFMSGTSLLKEHYPFFSYLGVQSFPLSEEDAELSNAEIAYRLAFSDPSHFNKFFKKQTQFTPVQYRSLS